MFGRGKEHRRSVRTGRRARAAADARRRFHRKIGSVFWNRDRIGFRRRSRARGDKSASLNDAIERTPVDHQIFDHWKTFHPEWFDHDRLSIAKFAHVKLAVRARTLRTMRVAG